MNTAATCASFRRELLCAVHALGTAVVRSTTDKDVFKGALFYDTASLGASTTAYSATGEISSSNYTAGGLTLTNTTEPASASNVAYWTPTSPSWTNITASGFDALLIYNFSQSNKAIAVCTFGSQSVLAGNFTVQMPTNDYLNALIRITPPGLITGGVGGVGEFTMTWNTPTTYSNGDPLNISDIDYFKIYYGTVSQEYTNSTTAANNLNTKSVTVSAGTYYIVMTTMDIYGYESQYTDEISVTVT